MNDISALLGGLADDAGRASEPVDVAHVLVQGRRRRRTRQIGTGLIAVAASAALVSGALAAPGLIGRAPDRFAPAAPATSASPGSSPTGQISVAEPEQLPACGSVPIATSLGQVDQINAALTVDVTYRWGPSAPTPGDVRIGEGGRDEDGLEVRVTPELLVDLDQVKLEVREVVIARDGVVVARTTPSAIVGIAQPGSEAGPVSTVVHPAACDKYDGWTESGGTYGVWTILGVDAVVEGGREYSATHVIGPEPIAVGGMLRR